MDPSVLSPPPPPTAAPATPNRNLDPETRMSSAWRLLEREADGRDSPPQSIFHMSQRLQLSQGGGRKLFSFSPSSDVQGGGWGRGAGKCSLCHLGQGYPQQNLGILILSLIPAPTHQQGLLAVPLKYLSNLLLSTPLPSLDHATLISCRTSPTSSWSSCSRPPPPAPCPSSVSDMRGPRGSFKTKIRL